MKLNIYLFLIFISNIGYSQTRILDEDFNDNNNGWEISLTDPTEKANVSSGRYDLYTLDKQHWHYFTISKEFNSRYDFAIESGITKLPRDNNYQKINVSKAIQVLSLMNYSNKSDNKIIEGLKIIEHQQSLGVRYNVNFQGRFETYFSNIILNKSDQDELSHAIGFIQANSQQILYSDELYGITWGGNSNRNLFSFNIYPEFKLFNVICLIDGVWTKLIELTKSDKITSGNSFNKLGIAKIDDYLYFYINDEKVGKVPFQQFYGSKVGFFVGPETHISVDNIIIGSNDPKNSITSGKLDVSSNNTFTNSGSGFLISAKGYFVTNYHVIAGANEVWIETNYQNEKKLLKAKVEVVDKNNDLAILKLDNLDGLPQPIFGISSQTVDVGTSVFAMGYPLLSVLGEEIKITDGIISSKTGYQGDVSTYQISAPIQPGNSGGALFDKRGYLIGITNAGVTNTQNIGYAIKTSYLLNLLELLPDKINLQLPNKIENLSFTEKIKELTTFVVIIKTK